ncbi:rhombosortase [Granulosicoccaceae sp. 1_MG-2023]|nr:rhombosortase [Granulosicoccaceae sp. 1_MG-2023]
MQNSLHSLLRTYYLPLLLGLISLLLQLGGYADSLRFDRTAIGMGQWWLLLSGNFVHLGLSHWLMNMSGLAMIALLFWRLYSLPQWLLIITASCAGVGLGLYYLNPELRWYVGFSGALHGLMIAGALADLRRYPLSGSVLLALVIAKLGWEQVMGSVPGSAAMAGGHVVVDAHLYGALSGALCGLLLLLLKRAKNLHRAG